MFFNPFSLILSNMLSYLEQHFDYDSNQCSPVRPDFERVVSYDSDGNEFVTWQKVDYSVIQSKNGVASSWSLNNLLKAGVNPDFPIHTGNPTRIEGVGVVADASAIADSILNESKSNESKSE